MYKASRDFVVLSLDGSHAVELNTEAHAATAPSILDHYLAHSFNSVFSNITLLTFARSYTMPKREPTRKRQRKFHNVIFVII